MSSQFFSKADSSELKSAQPKIWIEEGHSAFKQGVED